MKIVRFVSINYSDKVVLAINKKRSSKDMRRNEKKNDE